MERIDPEAVNPPSWFEANPGRAADLAFVVFAGSAQDTRAIPITNARWALSAFVRRRPVHSPIATPSTPPRHCTTRRRCS